MAFWKAIGFPVVRADDDEEEEEIEDPQQTLRVSTVLSADEPAYMYIHVQKYVLMNVYLL